MPKLPNKPEASPRFIFWSDVISVVAVFAVVALDYANGLDG
jgi:hypothetical protein